MTGISTRNARADRRHRYVLAGIAVALGVVVGPLIVAVLVEAVDLLADEVNGDATFTELMEEGPE